MQVKDCRKAAPKEEQGGNPANQTRGKARINTTLLKMLNGLIKPDRGSITMRGRVASWSMQKTPQANGAPLHSLPATLYSSQRRRRPLELTKTD
jgi:energy-coupling factor transporter ATP-binding protein EcfA2